MPRVMVSTGPVEYRESGRGLPVLVLHGTPGGSDQGVAAAQALGLDGRVLAPSRPGYLGTPLTTGPSAADQAGAMVGLLDALAIEDAVVIGTSGGGMAAVELAARHPGRVSGLVLWSAVTSPMRIWSGPLLHGPLSRRSTSDRLVRLLRRHPRLLVGRAAEHPVAVDSALAIAATVFPVGPRRDGIINDTRCAAAYDPLATARVTVPTLVVHGTKDRNVPVSQATRAAEAIPGSRLVTVRGGTHWTTMADPAAREALRQFLVEVRGPDASAAHG
jgi:pimeloyl-ACP methyl ester carboxylesterase